MLKTDLKIDSLEASLTALQRIEAELTGERDELEWLKKRAPESRIRQIARTQGMIVAYETAIEIIRGTDN